MEVLNYKNPSCEAVVPTVWDCGVDLRWAEGKAH
jgi:hypothetical protein